MENEQVEAAYIQVFQNADAGANKLQNSVVKDRLLGKSSSGDREKGGSETHIIKVQFNPSTLSFSSHEREKMKTSLTQSGQEKGAAAFADNTDTSINVGFKLIFDKTIDEDVNVQPDVEKFLALVKDPYVRQAALCWGDMSYKGVLKNVEAEYVLFNAQGVPTRAIVSLTLEGV